MAWEDRKVKSRLQRTASKLQLQAMRKTFEVLPDGGTLEDFVRSPATAGSDSDVKLSVQIADGALKFNPNKSPLLAFQAALTNNREEPKIGYDADRLPHFAYQWELVNPHPEKEIAEIRIAIPNNKWDFTHRLLALTLRAVRKN